MNKGSFFYILLISVFLLGKSCKEKPVYPSTPEIEFMSVEKFPKKNPNDPLAEDSIIVSVNFKDGDGDLGLDPTELSAPYNEFDFVPNGTSKYKFVPLGQYVNCKKFTIGEFDGDGDGHDSVFVEPNLYYNNYFVNIYLKQPDKSFNLIKTDTLCPDFNQRFPILNPLDKPGPIRGTLSHSIKNLSIGFSGETIKLKIYILDRALNKSNIIETPEIFID